MKNVIFRLAVSLVISCTILATAIPILANATLNPPDLWVNLGFTACKLPCYAGIRIGQTSFDAAPDLIRAYLPATQGQLLVSGLQINFWALDNDQTLTGIIYPLTNFVNDSVDRISLTTRLRFAPLIAELGAPSCIWVDNENYVNAQNLMIFYWERENALIAAVVNEQQGFALLSGSWLTNAEISAITISQNRFVNCSNDEMQRWRGFAPVWHYAERRRAEEK